MLPTIQNQSFGNDIATPLAQVTVIDGDEGDCNIVDFCHFALTTSSGPARYHDNAWRRVVIDTGPYLKATKIVNTLENVTTKLRFPKLDADANWQDTLPVNELQITHPDDDHIGNAAGFLDRMCTKNKEYIKGCKVVYCQIPELFHEPVVVPEAPIAKGLTNECTYVGKIDKIDKTWENQMEQAGFVLNVECYPSTNRDWDLDKDDAQWDEKTKAGSNQGSCTLSYKEAAARKGLNFAIVAKVVIYLPHGDLVATYKVKTKPDRYESTVSRNKRALGPLMQPILLSASQVEKLTSIQPQTIKASDWLPDGPKAKKLKTGLPKLMSGMVITNPPRQPFSVKQVVDLGTKIKDLNETTKANLTVEVPRKGMITRPNTPRELRDVAGQQQTIGPSDSLYKNMMRRIMLNHYALHEKGVLNSKRSYNVVDGDIVNRSSVITRFERHDKDGAINASFSMLFTGDAFDTSCDIRDTLISWNPQVAPPGLQVDVLKIPHHGSDRTASAGFYRYCKAYVYIVSGSHCNPHGNPKLSSIEAIVGTFYQRTAPNKQPFRIFFSNPKADEDYKSTSTASRSAVKAILANAALRPGSNYKYEMYKLKEQTENYAAHGTILFGKDSANQLITRWDASSWDRMT